MVLRIWFHQESQIVIQQIHLAIHNQGKINLHTAVIKNSFDLLLINFCRD